MALDVYVRFAMIASVMKLQLPTLQCQKCGHEWFPRRRTFPKVCPECKRADWTIPRKDGTIPKRKNGVGPVIIAESI